MVPDRSPSIARFILGSLLVATLLMGCSRIQEPWVRDPEELEEERARSPAMNDRLRERAAIVQGAR